MPDGIVNVNVSNGSIGFDDLDRQLQRYHELLMAVHLRGKHPYGSMRRDCPLCIHIHNLGRDYEGAMQLA